MSVGVKLPSLSRAMAVLEPLRVVITNYPSDKPTPVTVPNFPGNEAMGTHTVPFDKEIWIERSDFREVRWPVSHFAFCLVCVLFILS